jgi:hypothetical protein
MSIPGRDFFPRAAAPKQVHGSAPPDAGQSEERERVQRRIEGFNWQKSFAWFHLCCMYGPKLKQDELLSIADILAKKLEIKLDRDARRRKAVMIKWFEENWIRIRHLLPFIVLDD